MHGRISSIESVPHVRDGVRSLSPEDVAQPHILSEATPSTRPADQVGGQSRTTEAVTRSPAVSQSAVRLGHQRGLSHGHGRMSVPSSVQCSDDVGDDLTWCGRRRRRDPDRWPTSLRVLRGPHHLHTEKPLGARSGRVQAEPPTRS